MEDFSKSGGISGLGTIASLGLTGFKAGRQVSAAGKDAKAVLDSSLIQSESVIDEGILLAQQKTKQVTHRAASLRVSFINSGLTLAGTPAASIKSVFATGLEDVDQILANTKASSRNIAAKGQIQADRIISAGRTSALSTILGGLQNIDFSGFTGGSTGGFNPATSAPPPKPF